MLNLKTYSIELTGYLSSEYFLDSAKETKFSWECWVGNKIYSRLDWWLQHSVEFKAILCLITSLLDLANSHSLCFKSTLADALNSHFLQFRLSAILRCFVLFCFFSKLGFQSLRFCTNRTSALTFRFYSLDSVKKGTSVFIQPPCLSPEICMTLTPHLRCFLLLLCLSCKSEKKLQNLLRSVCF